MATTINILRKESNAETYQAGEMCLIDGGPR